jgi:hypothetical protein
MRTRRVTGLRSEAISGAGYHFQQLRRAGLGLGSGGHDELLGGSVLAGFLQHAASGVVFALDGGL